MRCGGSLRRARDVKVLSTGGCVNIVLSRCHICLSLCMSRQVKQPPFVHHPLLQGGARGCFLLPDSHALDTYD